jgi:hypothetical protein
MPRIYDSSQLTKRRGQLAIAGGFLRSSGTAPPNNFTWHSRSPHGISDSSIINEVKTGSMTQYTRYPTCIAVSLGCPCDPVITESLVTPPYIPALPGAVSGITYTVGSIIVSWIAPTVGDGPFTYTVTPFLNGVAQDPITTSDTSYRFTGLQEGQPYTFTVVASNAAGQGPVVHAPYFLAPPDALSTAMSGSSAPINPDPCLAYIMNAGLDNVLEYIASANMGPTRGSRIMYLFAASVTQAWNWVTADTNVQGIHDNWNWTLSKAAAPLSTNDCIIWMASVIDFLASQLHTIPSIYNCPADVVARVKSAGQWDNWVARWGTWYINRLADGSAAAGTAQPTSSANWNQTIIVDGVTVNPISGFPQPQEWTRLTVNGNLQRYLTYSWASVASTCLSAQDEVAIQALVRPAIGEDRDAEIDDVLTIAQNLTDEEKMIAEFWSGSTPGTMSPPLMSIWLWKEYIRSNTFSCPTIMYSFLDLAIHLFEGARVTWAQKYAFMESRPIQEIRRRYSGQQIASWNGTISGDQWLPYQVLSFVSPPFPDFPSGHSHFTQAFANTMNKWFGATISKHTVTYDLQTLYSTSFTTNQTAAFGDFVLPAGSSAIQPGVTPVAPITLSFDTWQDMADQAGMSRLFGGIHTISAHYASQTTANTVHTHINDAWGINPSP